MIENARSALFLHVPLGLSLSSEDLISLLDAASDPHDQRSIERCLRSDAARAYLKSRPRWWEEAQKIDEESLRHGIRWTHLGQPDYPPRWYELSSRPLTVSYQGEPCWMQRDLIAVVGSRTPSTDSLLWMQRELVPFLVSRQVGVVSGGARGVDQWAHRLTADLNLPTVCVYPSGLLNPYPPAGERLWERILETGGCLMSTCALREPMHKRFFHIRNRWIAGLSHVCLVVEANRRSGSMLTARLANEEGRTVCTLPVSPIAAQGLGNLDLIVEGAQLMRDRRDLGQIWSTLRPNCA